MELEVDDVKLFGKWSYEDVKVSDISLEASFDVSMRSPGGN